MRRTVRSAFVTGLLLTAAACTTTTTPPPPPAPPPAVTVPPSAGVYKIGPPYQVDNIWYYPREQPDYDETGIASWYGPTFYGHRTANGEVYGAGDLTAAHRTLPLPVNVRVTNLDNGKSLVVRVNDRGPFAKGRIIDLSERAAELLGYKAKGTARVRVTFVRRADLQGGGASLPRYPPPSRTPHRPAAATAAVPGPVLAPPPPPNTDLPKPVIRTADPAVATEPTGIVTKVPVPSATHLYVQAGAFGTY